MRPISRSQSNKGAQTLAFFAICCGAIILLCGLAIDSGLLYLSKARLSRAVDGASLAAVGNFHRSNDETDNRLQVAQIMRNFAVANFTDLLKGPNGGISGGHGDVPTPTIKDYPLPQGGTGKSYNYSFNDGMTDTNGQFKRFVNVSLRTGAGGSITSATCSARCPVQTYFINFAGDFFRDLKVSSSAEATRNPRLIMVIVDRSASMLSDGGGAYNLPQAVVQFLNFFDTSSDNIGIVSFSSFARVEMPLTTNFLIAGTNLLYDAYQIDQNETDDNTGGTPAGSGVPGWDQEMFASNGYDPTDVANYGTSGVRRLKFGGQTSADEGMRLGMEQLMASPSFNNPDVVKYIVFFTDGKWNNARTLFAAPGYTNVVQGPPRETSLGTTQIVSATGTWGNDMAANSNIVPMPALSSLPEDMGLQQLTNAIKGVNANPAVATFGDFKNQHTNDFWQSADSGGTEPISSPHFIEGAPQRITNSMLVARVTGSDGTTVTNYYTHSLDVWLTPGSVNYYYPSNYPNGSAKVQVTVSELNNPTKHISITMHQGDSNELVVPGYIIDGLGYDNIDIPFTQYGDDYPRYRGDNYNQPFMWPDEQTSLATLGASPSTSLERQLLFRNYANLLTGYYILRPDDPLGGGTNQYITESPPGVQTARYGLGPYYPAGGFYWPFDLVGVYPWSTYCLTNATVDPDPLSQGRARHLAYSINMHSSDAAPEWAGEWFLKGTGGTGVTSGTGTTSVSSVIGSVSDWQNQMPGWVTTAFDHSGEGVMTNDPVHNSNLAVNVWRPGTFIGTKMTTLSAGASATQVSQIIAQDRVAGGTGYSGGYVVDGAGNYYHNSMAWSGRPTHYFDFSQSKWVAITANHTANVTFLPLGIWKTMEYAWHARAMNIKIYSVGYGSKVSPSQQLLLAQMANATNTTAGNPQSWDGQDVSDYEDGSGTAITYNASQPIGEQYFATNADDVSNDFYKVGQAINASLTQ